MERLKMRANIEILLAVLFTLFIGTGGFKIATTTFKKETLRHVSKGLGLPESFSQKLSGDN